jgi:hypothetical protein
MSKLSILPLLIASALAGCASMSESECRVADWARVGVADGARGERDSRLADYAEDCGKIGVVPDAAAYRKGWDNGIASFCTATNGWREGTLGHNGKATACLGQPGYEAFVRYFDAGMQVYRTQTQLAQNDSETNRLQTRLDASTNDDEKRRLRSELREIDYQQYRLRSQMAQQQMMGP